MAIFLLASEEMAIRVKKVDLDGSSSHRISSAGFVNGTVSTGI